MIRHKKSSLTKYFVIYIYIDMNYYIYKITNKINGKIYIGQARDVRLRWRSHKSSASMVKEGRKKRGDNGIQVIHLAIAKYGIENFTFEIIEEVDTLDEANERETYWVSYYDSYHNGYNLTLGGFNAPKTEEWKEKVKATRIANGSYAHSERTKKLISDKWHKYHTPESIKKTIKANKGRKLSKEHIEKIININKGNQYCLGHKQSQETILKRVAAINEKYGPKICNAPGCNRTDGYKFKGKRYCNKHVQRLEDHGSLELPPRPKPHLGKKFSDEHRKNLSESKKGTQCGKENPFYGKSHSQETLDYLRKINLGKEPPNKIKFSDEQVQKILSDPRGLRKIAKDFGVSVPVIQRIKKEKS